MRNRKARRGDRPHVGLLWHSDRSRNLGVGALTVGDIALVRQVAAELQLEPRFTIFMTVDRGDPYINDPAVSVMRMDTRAIIDPRGYWSRIADLDLMLDIGAGDSFADIYPFKRFRMMAATKVLALGRGVPLIFAPQTIGPFDKPGYRHFASWVLPRARSVVVRDHLSAAAVRKLAPGAELVESIDVAFALPWNTAQLPPSGKRRVGVNVSGLLYAGGYTGRHEFGLDYDYVAFTDGLLDALSRRDDIEVHLVPHVIEQGGVDDDCGVADSFARRYPGFIRAPDFRSPSEAKGYISALDLLIGARMHATIAAYSSGTAVLPVSYSRKFEGLFGALNYPWLVPHRGMATDKALAFVLGAMERPDAMRNDIRAGMLLVESKLDAYRVVLRSALLEATDRSA